ncbi:mRNA turnover protein 4, partial [Araneus ventricosus]
DLSKTKKHGLEGKKELYKKIQSNVENYAHVFVFAVNDMRNSKLKSVREQWKHSRFCIGKNKVMAMALGRTPEEEYRPNLHKIGQVLVGERGLLFTNQSVDEVTNWFQSYSAGDYARSGNIATEDVILPEGPLEQFPHNLESYLRQLGLPTTLKKGVIHLLKEHVVCSEGDRLSPETARILISSSYSWLTDV